MCERVCVRVAPHLLSCICQVLPDFVGCVFWMPPGWEVAGCGAHDCLWSTVRAVAQNQSTPGDKQADCTCCCLTVRCRYPLRPPDVAVWGSGVRARTSGTRGRGYRSHPQRFEVLELLPLVGDPVHNCVTSSATLLAFAATISKGLSCTVGT